MAVKIFYIFLLFFIIKFGNINGDICVEQTPCSCKLNEGEINISKLNTKQFYSDSQPNVTYYFSGCSNKLLDPKEYNLVNVTQSATGSLIKHTWTFVNFNSKSTTVSNQSYYIIAELQAIGYASDIVYKTKSPSDSHFQIVYNRSSNNTQSLPTITLICSNENDTELKIIDAKNDELRLYSPYACVIKEAEHGLSAGSKLIIIFVVFSTLYFGGGALVLYFMRGARGIEVIPNVEFFRELPSLVKDGVIFIFSGCRPSMISTAETYDRI